MNDTYGTIQLTHDDLKIYKDFFGDKTINQVREEAGQSHIVGGEKKYFEYMMEHKEVIPPRLTIVTNPFLQV